jgi:hypothetical protein
MAGLMAKYLLTSWIPAFAGMTSYRGRRRSTDESFRKAKES